MTSIKNYTNKLEKNLIKLQVLDKEVEQALGTNKNEKKLQQKSNHLNKYLNRASENNLMNQETKR